MKIRHFNALDDNYMYLISDDKTKECAVVDPAEPEEVKTTKFYSFIQFESLVSKNHSKRRTKINNYSYNSSSFGSCWW